MAKYNGFNTHTKTHGIGIINSTLEMRKPCSLGKALD